MLLAAAVVLAVLPLVALLRPVFDRAFPGAKGMTA
jgi:hypothetical protein